MTKDNSNWLEDLKAQSNTEEAKKNQKKNAQRVATAWRKLAKSKKYNWTREFGRFGI
jgi:hypothetical protein